MIRDAVPNLVMRCSLLLLVSAAACEAPPAAVVATPSPNPAPAQQEGAPQAAPPQEAPPPQPIPEGDIAARADIVTAALRRVESLIQPNAQIEQIDNALDDREQRIQQLRSELDAVNPGQISPRRIEDMELKWIAVRSELDAWRQVSDRRFATLQDERDALRDTRAKWEETQRAVADESELANRVDAVLARVIEVETRVRARRNTVAAVSDRIAVSQEAIADALQQIDAIGLQVRGRMLSRDAPPLWRAIARPAVPTLSGTADAGRDWLQAVRHYLNLRPGAVLFLCLLFPMLLIAAIRWRAEAAAATEARGDPPEVRALIQRPFSVALAATLTVSAVMLPIPLGSAADLRFLLAVVPITRLGSVVLDRRPRHTLYWLLALSVMAILGALGPDGAPSTRIFLLLLSGLALVSAVRAARAPWATVGSRAWARAARLVAAVFAALLLFALVANVFGWVNLSLSLTEATIFSLFTALAWVVVVATAAALLPLFITGALGRTLPSLRRRKAAVVRVSLTLLSTVAVFVWVRGTLLRFGLATLVDRALERFAAAELHVGGLTISAGRLLAAALTLLFTWWTARLVGFFTREEVIGRLQLRRGAGQSVVTLVNYAVWGVGIALAASAAGLTGTQLAVVVGALGVGIGFGLQNIVNNFVSGLILIFERPIQVGDTVETPDFFGKVERIGIRASVIRSFDGAEIVVPNGDLISKAVTNWTYTDEIRRVEVLVGVAYGSDPEAVLEILQRVAAEHPKALDQPEVKAQMIRFGDSSLDFRLRCWAPMEDWLDVASDLHVAINRELATAKITIPFPQRDLHIKSGSGSLPPE